MLLAFAVAPRDADQALRLMRMVTKLGGAEDHDAVLIADGEIESSMVDALHLSLMESFRGVQIRMVHTRSGWPLAPNDMFRAAADYAEGRGQPWYFVEPDCLPIRPGWLNALAHEYALHRRPFMGAVEQHWIQATQWERVPAGQYLMGSAIYPPDLRRYTCAHCLPTEQPFDIAMMRDIEWHLIQHTRLILNCWNTVNYRRDGEEIVCDPCPIRAGQSGTGLPNRFSLKGPAVVHGCKDSSLYDLINGC